MTYPVGGLAVLYGTLSPGGQYGTSTRIANQALMAVRERERERERESRLLSKRNNVLERYSVYG